MAITRHGATPDFMEFLVENTLVPENTTNLPSSNVSNITKHWIYIPNYQRGVTWDTKFINYEFLKAESPLLGHIMLAQWRLDNPEDNNYEFSDFLSTAPREPDSFYHLLDGLQRFSVGTMILNVLNNLVFAPSGKYHSYNSHFGTLNTRIANRNIVYLYNHGQFAHHPRRAIQLRYNELYDNYTKYFHKIMERNDQKEIINYFDSINDVMLDKQVALDPFTGFKKLRQIIKVFLGINTVRIELNDIDIIRSYIIEKAKSASWTHVNIENIENRFEKVFINRTLPKSELKPFASILLQAIEKGKADRFFPSYSSKLRIKDVEIFLDYIEDIQSSIDPYVTEIKKCGDNPYAVLISYYLMDYLHYSKKSPLFLAGNTYGTEAKDLNVLLRAMYRSVIDLSMNRVKTYAEKICLQSPPHSIQNVADKISYDSVNVSIHQKMKLIETEVMLQQIGTKTAPRIFNACIIPSVKSANTFNPLHFGSRSNDFHIDHLIARKHFDKQKYGGKEADLLFNFAPIQATHNVVAKTTLLSQKIKVNGIYDNPSVRKSHPFNDWLIKTHYKSIANKLNFDDQQFLIPNRTNDIGLMRIKKIAEMLILNC